MGGDGTPVPAGVVARTRRATEALVAALGAAGRTLEDEVVDVRLDHPRASRTVDGLAPARSPVRSAPTIDAGAEIDRVAREPA